MLIAMKNHYVENNAKVPILDSKQIKHYIEAEYMLFQNRLSKMISNQVAEAKGNAFCQLISDAVTLVNKNKYQDFGLQFTHMKFRCNHVVPVVFKWITDNTAAGVSELSKKGVNEDTNCEWEEIVGLAVQYEAAKAIAKMLKLERDTYNMILKRWEKVQLVSF